MKELARDNYVYYKLEEPNEVDGFHIKSAYEDGFDFFRGLGIIGYPKTFKMWLRKFPRPIFLLAVDGREVISWAFIEEWEGIAKDGTSVYVLRAIETLPKLRSKKIGFKLLLLALQQITGYIIVKPLTPKGENFFRNAGFLDESEFTNPPVDLSQHSGYFILPPYKRKETLKDARYYFKSTTLSFSS
jgi:GNAT superfamily N-acetyltransferase